MSGSIEQTHLNREIGRATTPSLRYRMWRNENATQDMTENLDNIWYIPNVAVPSLPVNRSVLDILSQLSEEYPNRLYRVVQDDPFEVSRKSQFFEGLRCRAWRNENAAQGITEDLDNPWEMYVSNATVPFFSFNQSASYIPIPKVFEEYMNRLYSAAQDELFEVGRKSQFSKGLQQLCLYDPVAVIQSLKVRLEDYGISAEVQAETLRWASDQDAIAIREGVIDFLTKGLWHPSSLVRDTAALSLASLDEDAAIIPLQRALEREQVPELREDLEALIRSLED